MAVDAGDHGGGAEGLFDAGCFVYDAVAFGAFDGCVFDVAEEDHVPHTVNALYRELADRVVRMAGLADGGCRESGTVAGLRRCMAVVASEFERGVLLVVEGGFLTRNGGERGYGSEKATNSSENVRLYLLPPPAAITTNCLRVF